MPPKAPRRRAPRGARKAMRKGRKFRPARSVSEWASCSETLTLFCQTSTMYQKKNLTLADFARASRVAANYQHFRIKRVLLQYRPKYDAYNAGGATVPYLIYMIDKSDTIPLTADSSALRRMGAKPIRFDDKTVRRQWRPSVLTSEESMTGISSTQYKISPWLSTNQNTSPTLFQPSNVKHFGIFWIIEQSGTPDYEYEVEMTVEFQFKKPLDNHTSPNAVPALLPSYLDLSGNKINPNVH